MSSKDTQTDDFTRIDRRTLLAATGSLATAVAVAGCTSGSTTTAGCSNEPENLDQPVPSVYEGATSNADITREPDRLIPRSEIDYQREPNGDQQCSKCSFYIPDKNGDCVGACVRIAGMVDPAGYCGYYRTQVGGGW